MANRYERIAQSAASDFSGMDEAVRLFKYLSSSGKNRVIRKSYQLATKKYRAALKLATPTGENRSDGKPLKNTISYTRSKKYANKNNLIDPLLTGHLVRRGAYHLHLNVLGRKAITTDRFALDRKRKGGGTKPRRALSFTDGGKKYVVKKVKGVKPNPFVGRVFASMRGEIEGSFATSFIKGSRFIAKKILKQYYVN